VWASNADVSYVTVSYVVAQIDLRFSTPNSLRMPWLIRPRLNFLPVYSGVLLAELHGCALLNISLGLIVEYLLVLLWPLLRISDCLILRLIGNKKYILGLILRVLGLGVLGHPTTTFIMTLDTASRRLKTTKIKMFRLRASGHTMIRSLDAVVYVL